ncbi:MAG: hypothetical protein AABX55_02245 [Nanoarchaeota archaeon]
MKNYYKILIVVIVLALALFLLNLFEFDITSQVVSDKGFAITTTNTQNVKSCSSRQDNYNPYLQGYASYVAFTRIDEREVKGDDFCLSRTTLKEMSCDGNKILRTTIGECKYGCVTDINGRGYCNRARTRSLAVKTTYGY